MTRTPPDMETAMSDKEAAEELANGLNALFSLVGADADIQIRDPEEAAAMMQCYELLSALGDPVVVAEALPELVEAAEGIECLTAREGENSLEHFERIAEMFYRDTRMLMPGKDAGLLPGPTEEDRLEAYEAWKEKPANRLRSVLSKLKARP